ncbi:MAG: DNA adenine methylase [Spirochaetales bacterium]|nr:DNA adenine methylase [Spirochaetales bacterium]
MKYMGSKRTMLRNGLGEALSREIQGAKRFVDLFSGSGSVAIYIAQLYPIPVIAFDLQSYSVVLASAVIARQAPLIWQPIWEKWYRRAFSKYKARRIPSINKITKQDISAARVWCDNQEKLPVTNAYGGHYFSPRQSVWIDVLRYSLPSNELAKSVALAALIQAASQCAAAPGHTAQPFQPTQTAKPFIEEAWGKDIVNKTKAAFEILAGQFAKRTGQAKIADANEAAKKLKKGDLVFIDPPYSSVHYSRFYHVLETIAQGSCGAVSGVGRYPASELRPRSKFSISTESTDALDDLLKNVASHDANAIITFPDHDCSNGLSGNMVRELASKYFQVREQQVNSKLSTLGGTGDKRGDEAGRSARKHTTELILVLKPL